MQVQKNVPLKTLNSFKIDVNTKFFAVIRSPKDIKTVLTDPAYENEKIHIMGDATNTLFTKDFDGLVMKIDIKGIIVIEENDEYIILDVGAGENWNGLVQYAINNGLAGIENMSLIPGTVGAAPVQNIAAYGQNFEDVFVSLTATNLEYFDSRIFTKEECKFAYRDSYFKREGKGKFIVTSVRIKLYKNENVDTSYHSRYESLVGELQQFTLPPYNIRDIGKAVTRIRERKFPDWEKIGTAGSFFLNPVITKGKLADLQIKFPDIQFYPIDKLTYPTPNDPDFDHANHVKVAAGWLLEELGWKGKRIGNVGTSPNQSLVVINYGNATAAEVLGFTRQMQKEFEKTYDIPLEAEVNII